LTADDAGFLIATQAHLAQRKVVLRQSTFSWRNVSCFGATFGDLHQLDLLWRNVKFHGAMYSSLAQCRLLWRNIRLRCAKERYIEARSRQFAPKKPTLRQRRLIWRNVG
jgi:hypothetical protein